MLALLHREEYLADFTLSWAELVPWPFPSMGRVSPCFGAGCSLRSLGSNEANRSHPRRSELGCPEDKSKKLYHAAYQEVWNLYRSGDSELSGTETLQVV